MTTKSLILLASGLAVAACIAAVLPAHPVYNLPGGVTVLGGLAFLAAIGAAASCVRQTAPPPGRLTAEPDAAPDRGGM